MPLDRRQILELLDLARWAPSGDNTQPWRFELLDEGGLRVHGSDTEAHCVYDYKGLPSRMAHGALLETLAIAAAAKGYAMQFATASDGGSGHTAIYDIRFIEADAVVEQGLFDSIRKRTVNRRPMSLSPLTRAEREALEKSAGSQYQLHWIQAFAERLRFARLLYQSAHIRLTIPEAFEVHRSVIEWGARFSNDRIPDRAVGLDPVATRLMQWVMGDWQRVRFFNRWLAGTVVPRIQLDFMPGICCAAHFVLRANIVAKTNRDFIEAGRAMQRV
ncbi:MAG TPA: nitroreductase family protein, partial [Rhodocyclaceae bacterium]|nr:nitroreductase family protein [Rhodocyclaceae bacterium]